MATLMSYSPIPPDPGSRSSSRRFMVSPALSDQQSQLDDIIGDLLSDKAFMTDHGEINPLDMNGIVMPQHGSITTQNGNSRTVLSWQTHQSGPNRSLSTPSGSRAGSRPSSRAGSRPSSRAQIDSDSIRKQSSSVQKLPGGGISSSSSKYEEDHWTTGDTYHHFKASEETKKYEEKKFSESNFSESSKVGAPLRAGSKSPPPPPVRRRMFSPDQLSSIGDTRQGPPQRKIPITTDSFQKRSVSETRPYSSDTEDAGGASWLDSQKVKLYEKRDSRTESEQIMSRSSGYSSTNRSYVAQSDTEDRRGLDEGPVPARPPPPISSYDSLDELSNLLTESSRDLSNSWSKQQKEQKQWQEKQQWQEQQKWQEKQQWQEKQKQQKTERHHQMRSSSVGAIGEGPYPEPTFFVSGLEKPAFSKQQTKYVFAVSPSPTSMLKDDGLEDQFNRQSCLSPPPPRRGDSSKEAVKRNVEPTRTVPSVDELDAALAKILQDSKPEPETERLIEEEIISLEPIGRGIQTLEPDLDTLSRNRSRAVSPVYPGFPTPGYRSPSLGRMMGGGVSPTPSGMRSVTPARAGRTLSPQPYQSGTMTSSNSAVTSSRITESVKSSNLRKEEGLTATEAVRVPVKPSPSVPLSPATTGPATLPPRRAVSPLIGQKEEDLEQAINSMMTNAEPFKKTAAPKTAAPPQQNGPVSDEPVLSAAVSSRAQQLQKVPEQLSALTHTTITRTQTVSSPYVRADSPEPEQQQQNLTYIEQQKNLLKQQQQLMQQAHQLQQQKGQQNLNATHTQQQQHSAAHIEQQQKLLEEQQQRVLEQQQQVLKQSQSLQQLDEQQRTLREKQQQLQKEQQELLRKQREQLQQKQQQHGGGWVVKEETVTKTYKGGERASSAMGGGSASAGGGSAYLSGGSANIGGRSNVTSGSSTVISSVQQQKKKEEEDLERQLLEIEQQMQQENANLSAQSSAKQFSASSSGSNLQQQQSQHQQNHQHHANCQHQHQGNIQNNSLQQQKSSTVQQLTDLSEKLQQLQQRESQASEQHYSTVSHQQKQQAASSSYAAGSSSLAGGSSYGQHNLNQSSSLAGSSSYGTGQQLSSGQQINQSSQYASAGRNTSQSATSKSNRKEDSRMSEKREEEYQETHYATVPSREARKAAALTAEASAEAQNSGTLGRSPSPSLWTNETLRSYTDRKHTGSVSPLLQPGHTLPLQGRASPYFGQSISGSVSSINDMDTLNHIPKFVRDSSRLWHSPNITREEAISKLRDKPPGSFIVRNSSTFHGAYGLALKVAQIPPNIQSKGGDPQTELVRHFLIEPTNKGVRLKGCSNEPVFGSLAALVYQHTITPLALPCKLLLPEDTEVKFIDATDSGSGALAHGAACNVLYLNSKDTESLTGPAALSKTIRATFNDNKQPKTTLVEFKVTTQGVTLTDNQRSLFFRRHYPMNTVTYCGIDEGERRWNPSNEDSNVSVGGRVFGFVARKAGSLTENSCHIFVEADPNQPASAIVDFITKIMIGHGQSMKS